MCSIGLPCFLFFVFPCFLCSFVSSLLFGKCVLSAMISIYVYTITCSSCYHSYDYSIEIVRSIDSTNNKSFT
ncbi:hypothetical protein DFJ77DRAFT_451844 [Powellomyces hirtus]|nr:hypothetical protein DFJ77DRAFT_451844 [Powellomyces hirtus]